MKKFKHPLSLPLLTLCLGLSALSINNHANAAESSNFNNSKTGSIKSSLQQEAINLSNLAADQTIVSAVQTSNQNQEQNKNQDQDKTKKLSKSESEKIKTNLSNNPLSQKLLDSQKTNQLKIMGLMVTDKNGNSLGQTMPVKTINHPAAAKFVTGQIQNPKITQRVKISFSPKPVSKITVGILDPNNSKQVIGTLTEWIDMGDK